MPDPVLWSQQRHAMLQAWGRVIGMLCRGKSSGCAGKHLNGHEPVVCPGIQEGQWHFGLYEKQCNHQVQGSDHIPALSTDEAAS